MYRISNLNNKLRNYATAMMITLSSLSLHSAQYTAPCSADSVEVMAGTKSSTLDTKILSKVSSKLDIFVRNRATINYNRSAAKFTHFTLADLIYKTGSDFEPILEFQAAQEIATRPRPGFQFSRQNGRTNYFILSTAEFKDKPNYELILSAAYRPKIDEKSNVLLQVETVTNAGPKFNFSTQRIRIGKEQKNYSYGIAYDILQVPGKTQTNLGLFYQNKF